jgi:hypothetical protein
MKDAKYVDEITKKLQMRHKIAVSLREAIEDSRLSATKSSA